MPAATPGPNDPASAYPTWPAVPADRVKLTYNTPGADAGLVLCKAKAGDAFLSFGRLVRTGFTSSTGMIPYLEFGTAAMFSAGTQIADQPIAAPDAPLHAQDPSIVGGVTAGYNTGLHVATDVDLLVRLILIDSGDSSHHPWSGGTAGELLTWLVRLPGTVLDPT